MTAKNYLNESEMKDLGLLVEQELSFPEYDAAANAAELIHIHTTQVEHIPRLLMTK